MTQQSWLALPRSNVKMMTRIYWLGMAEFGGDEELIFGQELTLDQRSDLQLVLQ